MSREPDAWMLRNARTGKLHTSKGYVRREAAEAGAAIMSSRWKSYVAVPVFSADFSGPDTDNASEALFAIRNQLSAAKSSLMFNKRWTNEAGYITDAALWIERAISAAEEALSTIPQPLTSAPDTDVMKGRG